MVTAGCLFSVRSWSAFGLSAIEELRVDRREGRKAKIDGMVVNTTVCLLSNNGADMAGGASLGRGSEREEEKSSCHLHITLYGVDPWRTLWNAINQLKFLSSKNVHLIICNGPVDERPS